MSPIARALAALLTALAAAVPVAATEEEVASTTISAIERGEAQAMVYLEGAALEGVEDEYLFSDGTGTIHIAVGAEAGEGELPLFELVGIEGTLTDDGVGVSRWAPLRVMTPAVIVEEPQVIDAFWGWIVAYGSQAPAPTE